MDEIGTPLFKMKVFHFGPFIYLSLKKKYFVNLFLTTKKLYFAFAQILPWIIHSPVRTEKSGKLNRLIVPIILGVYREGSGLI